jgi:hypothetical protein
VTLTNSVDKNNGLSSDVRNTIRQLISDTTEQSLDLVVNISGMYLDKNRRKQFMEKVKQEIAPEYEKFIKKNILLGQEVVKEIEGKKVSGTFVKEMIYRFFENMRPLIDDMPEDVPVFDFLISALKEVKDIRFEFSYLENTEYENHIVMIENFLERLVEEAKIGSVGRFIWNFVYTNDAYALIQAAFQTLPAHYLFLERVGQGIEKAQVNKYLEIYDYLAGHFEKLVYLLVGLVKTLEKNHVSEYLSIKRNRLSNNLEYLQKSGYSALVAGFDRHVRNALAHQTYKVDLINEVVIFYDVCFELEKSFRELQKATEELSANLLIMPNLFILTFYLALSQFKMFLDKLE